eukprot:Sspe_Gene.61412::Locus_34080_Transcript_1_1_Confidence_1.000_Length_943::g.61412::m.61412
MDSESSSSSGEIEVSSPVIPVSSSTPDGWEAERALSRAARGGSMGGSGSSTPMLPTDTTALDLLQRKIALNTPTPPPRERQAPRPQTAAGVKCAQEPPPTAPHRPHSAMTNPCYDSEGDTTSPPDLTPDLVAVKYLEIFGRRDAPRSGESSATPTPTVETPGEPFSSSGLAGIPLTTNVFYGAPSPPRPPPRCESEVKADHDHYTECNDGWEVTASEAPSLPEDRPATATPDVPILLHRAHTSPVPRVSPSVVKTPGLPKIPSRGSAPSPTGKRKRKPGAHRRGPRPGTRSPSPHAHKRR